MSDKVFEHIELNETQEDKKAGRIGIVMSASTIHNRGEWNRRGMTWLESYVENNIESIIGAPYVVSFIDENKSMPSDHGTLTYDDEGNCQFLDSDVVGSIQKAWIQEFNIDGKNVKKLMTSGFLYKQRYPNFIKWLKDEIGMGTNVKGSVEANGKGDSKTIIYEDGSNGKDSSGEWIIGRVPVVYDYSGLAILLPNVVNEADVGSEILELNSMNKSTGYNSDDINIKIEEEEKMSDINKDTIVELNDKIVELNNTVNDLTSQIASKDVEINSLKTKEEELNSLLVEANKAIEGGKSQLAELNTEIEPLRVLKADVQKAQSEAEINSYFKTIKEENGFTEAELNSLKTEYVDKLDLNGLKLKEQELCVNKFKEQRKVSLAESEINNQTNTDTSLNTLFFSTKQETVETNKADNGDSLFN